MRQFTGQNENRAERSRKKEKRIPFPILYAQTLEIEQKESSENRFFLFLSPSNLPEKLIFLFFTTLKKKSLKFLPLKTVLSCLGIFLFFPSSSFSRERETTKLFGKIFISFFFFLRSREFRRVVLILIRDNLSKFEKTLESRYYSFALKILMRLLFLSTC